MSEAEKVAKVKALRQPVQDDFIADDFVPDDFTPESTPQPGVTDNRTALQVAGDQAVNVIKGIPQAITGIPSAAIGAANAIGSAISGRGIGQGVDMVKGALSPITTSVRGLGALIAPESVAAPSQQEWEQGAQGAGAFAGGVALGAAGSAIGSKLAKVKALREFELGANPAATAVERNIAPRSREARSVTRDIAPTLAEDPRLAKTKAIQFDMNLFNRWRNASGELDAAAQSVAKGTKNQTAPIMSEIESQVDKLQTPTPSTMQSRPSKILDEYGQPTMTQVEVPGEPIAVNPEALRVYKEWHDNIGRLGPQVDFETLRDLRQKIDKEIANRGGFKDTTTAAERAQMVALRNVSGAIRRELSTVSERLNKANAEYSLTHQAMDASGLDFDTGRREINTGAARKPSILKRAVKNPYVVGSVLGGGAAKGLYDVLTGK